MGILDFLLYLAWFAFPLFYITLATWLYLERFGGKKVLDDLGFYWKQALFTLICALVALGIDQYYIKVSDLSFLPELLPVGIIRVMLFPAILMIAGKITGGTQTEKLSSSPKVGGGKPRTKGR